MNIESLIRENIRTLKPYSCARDEFSGKALAYLDANENPYNDPYNRYPDPYQWALKSKISKIKNVPVDYIFLGNGSDEAIDLIYRAFCEPKEDNVVAIEPTYGMYRVCADINGVDYRVSLLNEKFEMYAYKVMDATNQRTKIIWLCSPNNPTGNLLNKDEIIKLLGWFRGLVVVDEAYIDFSDRESLSSLIPEYPNLIILQTFSKAWGSAAVRLGMAFASPKIIAVLNSIKYPYNINYLTQDYALKMLDGKEQVDEWVNEILKERDRMIKALKRLNVVKHIYPTDANFLLVKVDDAMFVYRALISSSVIVRNRNNISLCNNCIRITIGTSQENNLLLEELKKL